MDGPSPSIPVLYAICLSNAIYIINNISNAILDSMSIAISHSICYIIITAREQKKTPAIVESNAETTHKSGRVSGMGIKATAE